MSNHLINGVEVIVEKDSNMDSFLKETKYCDFSNPEIKQLAFEITKNIEVLHLLIEPKTYKVDNFNHMSYYEIKVCFSLILI